MGGPPFVNAEVAGRRRLPSSVDPAGFGRLHLAVAETLIEHATAVGKRPYRFSERYDVAVRLWHKLNPPGAPTPADEARGTTS